MRQAGEGYLRSLSALRILRALDFSLPSLYESQWLGFFLALAFSLILTPFVTARAIQMKILDQPDSDRRIHKVPVPRLGGIAIFLSFLLVCILFIVFYGRYTPVGFKRFELLGILLGSTLIFIVGLLDDLSPLPALVKLIAQIMAASTAWFCQVQVKFIANPLFFFGLADTRALELDPLVSFLVTVFWLVLITNALNLIDGLDGLAGGVALICSLSLWAILLDEKIMEPAGGLTVAIIAGSILGFLRSNYNPARIFLGDCGAYFLGFVLGAVAVAGLTHSPNTATIGSIVVIAFSFPLIDTALAVFRRLLKGKPIMQPDAEHIHHSFLKAGLSTKATMYVIYLTCGLLGFLASAMTGSLKRYLILVLLVVSLFILNAFWRRKQG